jgi:DNA-binding transcriptional ArsR family regulator
VIADWTTLRPFDDGSQLSDLLGPTRASVMEVLSDRVLNTTEIAHSTGISIASASEHAAVLRAAGPLTSTRARSRVNHQLTPLGVSVLWTARTGRSSAPPYHRSLS